MKKAFSIMELLVAVALLAVTMTAVGGVFKMSIESQRVAAATSANVRPRTPVRSHTAAPGRIEMR